MFYEPHPKSGYPHIHIQIFGEITEEEQNHLRDLWKEMTKADWEAGMSFTPGKKINYLISYIFKYISKTLHEGRSSWTWAEWVFNAIAHAKRYRLFSASNNLRHIMKGDFTPDETTIWENVAIGGLKQRTSDDEVTVQRVWTNPDIKRNFLVPLVKRPSTRDSVKDWLEKHGGIISAVEREFRRDYERWADVLPLWRFRKLRFESRIGTQTGVFG
jgi:hypothetical protein